jgi:tRNA A-37 threonylcarbamoyl transferase component Bud32
VEEAKDTGLSTRQIGLLDAWIPNYQVIRDHSWGLVATTVLEVDHDGRRYIVKAGGHNDHHTGRELRAHRQWLTPWTAHGRAPALVYGDDDAKLVVTRFLPGQLVQGTVHEAEPDAYRQAGVLLAQLHQQFTVADNNFKRVERAKALAWLDKPHRIAADVESQIRAEVDSWPTPTTTLVPTHGDWQPRNWLIHDGIISIIDFGRAALRPAISDLTRLSAQQFREDLSLEAAFIAGYDDDPREAAAWHRTRIREAVGTAVWAFQVGDEAFEAQGNRMISDALGSP